MKWFQLAAEQGLAVAQYHLGVMYRVADFMRDDGIPQNNFMAYVWYSVAAAQGDENARAARDLYHVEPGTIFSVLTLEQLARAQNVATRCFESGYKDCALRLN